jgi:magnesium-transporting ATPase (P-type)
MFSLIKLEHLHKTLWSSKSSLLVNSPMGPQIVRSHLFNSLAQSSDAKRIENVNFEDPTFYDHFNNKNSVNYKSIEAVLLHLALCHTIILDERTGKYNASSPDELALVNAGKFFGAEFRKRDEDNNMIIEF